MPTYRPRTASRPTLIAMVALAAVACGGPTSRPSEVEPTGPPEIRAAVVADHAEQLNEELGDRPAGSQREQAASQYVLGHLQLAGYFVQLDAVPVENLVESTNLVALPPSGDEPHTIVTVAYDAEHAEATGEAVGVFLELARALYAADPDHRVEFVALGAENTEEHLGSRRLAQQLRDENRSPRVITIAAGGERFGVVGDLADALETTASDVGVTVGSPPPPESYGNVDVFDRAGLETAVVRGGTPQGLGEVLLAYLTADAK